MILMVVLDNLEKFCKKNKEVLQILGMNVVILLIFWGGLLHNQYNADTIFYRYQGAEAACSFRIAEGRFLVVLLYYILPRLGINVATRISLTTFINLLLFAIAITINYFVLVQDKKVDILKVLCVDLVFINVFFVEMLMFAEAFFGIAYFFASLAILCYCKKKKVGFALSMMCAVCTYQYTAIYVAIILLFVIGIKYSFKISKASATESFWATFWSVFAGFANIMFVEFLAKIHVLSAEKVNEENHIGGNLTDKINSIISDTISIFRDCKGLLMGRWFFLLVSLTICMLVLVIFLSVKDWNRVGYFGILVGVTFLLRILIPSVKADFDNPPRFAFSYFLVQGLFLLAIYVSLSSTEFAFSDYFRKWMKVLVSCLIVMYVLLLLLATQDIVNSKYYSKAIDETYVRLMYQKVQKYEEETGVSVTKFAGCTDESYRDAYEEIGPASFAVNERVLGKATWSIVRDISGREFERIAVPDEVYQAYFAGKDWKEIDFDEQLVIIDDTAYWCIY